MKTKWLVVIILILALLCVCGVIIFILASQLHLGGGGVQLGLPRINNISAEADEEQRFTVSGAAALDVDNAAGDITVTGGEGSEIVVTAHKTAWANSEAEAQADLETLKVDITQTGNTIKVKVVKPQTLTIAGAGRSDTVDFTISVPEETSVSVHTGYGEVSLSGTTGDANLYSSYGNLTISGLQGGLNAETNSGVIEASIVNAGQAAITLSSDYGNVSLENSSAGDVSARSSSGSITLKDVQAINNMSAKSGYGKIQGASASAATLTADTNSGEVTLSGLSIDGALDAHSDYGAISLKQVAAGSYDLSSNSGDVSVDSASGSVKISSDYGDIEVTNGDQVTLDLDTNSGTVSYSGTLGKGPHSVNSNYGAITLALPADSALSVDLKTDYGRVRSDLAVTMSGDLNEEHWVGTINGGGESLTVTTNSGDIRIQVLEQQ
jgi:DUF4097 and DUF4098 domain-containing protein YvlB